MARQATGSTASGTVRAAWRATAPGRLRRPTARTATRGSRWGGVMAARNGFLSTAWTAPRQRAALGATLLPSTPGLPRRSDRTGTCETSWSLSAVSATARWSQRMRCLALPRPPLRQRRHQQPLQRRPRASRFSTRCTPPRRSQAPRRCSSSSSSAARTSAASPPPGSACTRLEGAPRASPATSRARAAASSKAASRSPLPGATSTPR